MNRKSFNSDDVHKHLQEHLNKLSVPNKVIDLLEVIFDDLWSKKGKLQGEILKDTEKRVKQIEEEIKVLKGRLITTDKENMIEFYENSISTLLEEKELLEMKLKNGEIDSDTNYKKLLDETKAVLINPKFIWEIGNLELKHLLLGVCFGSKIYYTKNQGLQTPDIPLIYKLKEQLSGNKTQDLDQIVFLLNQNNYNIESFKADLEKICIFGISLLKQGNLDKYSKYNYLLSEYGVGTIL